MCTDQSTYRVAICHIHQSCNSLDPVGGTVGIQRTQAPDFFFIQRTHAGKELGNLHKERTGAKRQDFFLQIMHAPVGRLNFVNKERTHRREAPGKSYKERATLETRGTRCRVVRSLYCNTECIYEDAVHHSCF